MVFENLQAEIGILIARLENQPEEKHELYMQIREKLNELRALGLPLPADLVEFEERLEAEFKDADKQ
jgi:hypothetical protein